MVMCKIVFVLNCTFIETLSFPHLVFYFTWSSHLQTIFAVLLYNPCMRQQPTQYLHDVDSQQT